MYIYIYIYRAVMLTHMYLKCTYNNYICTTKDIIVVSVDYSIRCVTKHYM